MTDSLEVLGSFATVWIVLWFACAGILSLAYPLLRQSLLRWHPAIAGNLLMLLLAFPFLLSLSSTLLLFTAAFDSLVSVHCHENCAAHMPIIATPGLAPLGLLLVTAILLRLAHRLWVNLRLSRRLKCQLEKMADHKAHYELLDTDKPVVFTLGWWRNQIYVTRGLQQACSEQDLAVILAHENAHSRRCDNIRLLIAMLFTLVLPRKMARLLHDDLHLMVESACDFEAAKQFGDLDVAETLLKIQKLSPLQWQIGSQVILSAFTGAEIELRIKALIHGRQKSLWQQTGFQAAVLALIMASFLLVDPLHHGIEELITFF
jgi:beta-lactamase regulating signal transducer with metallopeptidase domain